MIKPEFKDATVYVKILDRNINVSEETEEFLKAVCPHVLEEVKHDSYKQRRGKHNSDNANRKDNSDESELSV